MKGRECTRQKRNEACKKVDDFNNKIMTGFDIRTNDIKYQITLEEKYSVKKKMKI